MPWVKLLFQTTARKANKFEKHPDNQTDKSARFNAFIYPYTDCSTECTSITSRPTALGLHMIGRMPTNLVVFLCSLD